MGDRRWKFSLLFPSQFFARVVPLWIAMGKCLAVTIGLLSWNENVSLRVAIAASCFVVVILALSFYWYMAMRQEARRNSECIGLVNHHVRNALQILHLLELPAYEHTLVRKASSQILWTLQEVLERSKAPE
jgi:hypothetical protein